MLKHWQVAVDVPYRARILLHRDSTVDLRHPIREYRQLQLGHPSLLNPLPSSPQIHFWLILFSLTARNYWARSGGLKLFIGNSFLECILGWIAGLKITGAFDDEAFRRKAGQLQVALKARIKPENRSQWATTS